MQPFVTQTWKIGGPVSMLETICEEESTLDKVTKEWQNFLNESNQVMSKDQLLNYVRNNIDQDLTVQEDTVGNAFDIIGVKKNGVLILFDGHDSFDITVPDGNYQVNMETGAIDFSEHSHLFEKNQTVGMMYYRDQSNMYAQGMAISRDNYSDLLSQMSTHDLKNECANQIFLSNMHADDKYRHSHWRMQMCKNEAMKRNPNVWNAAKILAGQI
jgi:hypothetical protein